MCHYDQNNCVEAIIKDGWIYIVDDYKGSVKMKYQEFEEIIKKYQEVIK